jgi:hypothetical protein
VTDLWSKADLHVHSLYSDGADDIPSIRPTFVTTDEPAYHRYHRPQLHRRRPEAATLAPVWHPGGHRRGDQHRSRPPAAYFLQQRLPPASRSTRRYSVHDKGGVPAGPSLRHAYATAAASLARPTLDGLARLRLDGLEGINGSMVDPTANPRSQAMGGAWG